MKKIIFVISIIIILILIAIYGILNNNKNEGYINNIGADEYNMELDTNIQLVKGKNEFFTVASCFDKYIYYVSSKDKESITKLLNPQYKDKFHINKDNVMEHVEKFDVYYKFKAEKMYYKEKTEDISIYYVFGDLVEDGIDDIGGPQDYYVTVILNTDNMTYSIMPFGYMCSDEINSNVQSENLIVETKEYVAYFDKCQIKFSFSNISNKEFNCKNNISLKYYNNDSLYNYSELDLVINPNESKEIVLEFENEAMIPEKLIINYEERKLEIPIVKDLDEIK